jgi:hypothetical protein
VLVVIRWGHPAPVRRDGSKPEGTRPRASVDLDIVKPKLEKMDEDSEGTRLAEGLVSCSDSERQYPRPMRGVHDSVRWRSTFGDRAQRGRNDEAESVLAHPDRGWNNSDDLCLADEIENEGVELDRRAFAARSLVLTLDEWEWLLVGGLSSRLSVCVIAVARDDTPGHDDIERHIPQGYAGTADTDSERDSPRQQQSRQEQRQEGDHAAVRRHRGGIGCRTVHLNRISQKVGIEASDERRL